MAIFLLNPVQSQYKIQNKIVFDEKNPCLLIVEAGDDEDFQVSDSDLKN
jgi:hypothetical protein